MSFAARARTTRAGAEWLPVAHAVRAGLLALLVVTCLIDRFAVRAGPFNVRSEQLAALLGLAYVGYAAFTRRGRPDVWRPNRIELLIGLWLVVSLISSVVFAPSVTHSLKGLGLLALSSLGMLLPRRLVDRRDAGHAIETLLRVFLVAIAVEAAYGTAAWLLHAVGPTISISANGATGHFSAYGTLWEPNVFGACCAAGAVAWTWLGPRYFKSSWIGIAVCLGGTMVSFTRAAWVAALVVLALGFLGPLRQHIPRRRLMIGVVAAAVIAMVAVGAEHIGNYYVPVATGTATGAAAAPHGVTSLLANEVDVIGRLYQVYVAAPDIASHPWLGNGTASYGVNHTTSGVQEHIANLELTVLYDTGIVGLLIFLSFGATAAWAAWKRRRDPVVAGLAMTALVFAITNTATETTELMITWLLVGLLLMAIDAAGSYVGVKTRST